jgi:O-antigen/teichoic acid export membrane protein
MNVKRKLAASSVWTVTASVFNNVSTMVVFIALARLLTPAQFGIVAFASVFIEFSRILVVAGIPDALIQRPEWDRDVSSTAFWTNIFIGMSIAAILCFVVAPIAGVYYDQTFSYVLAALSALLLIEGASTVHTAKLRREFRHKIIARRSMSANVIGGIIGVTLAYLGWGVWAMVISRLFASGMSSLLLWQSSGFRPRFHFSFAEYRQFGRFSSHQLGSQLLANGNAQVTALLIGSFLGPAAIAQYRVGSRALNMLVSLVITPLQSASMSAFSRVHETNGQIGPAYLRVTRACALLTCPLFFGMAATAPDIVRLMFGPKWHEAGLIMIALALVVGPATLNYFQNPALSAAGRTGLTFWATLVGFVGNLVVALCTVSFGPIAVAAGHTLRAYITTPLSLRFVEKGIGVSPWRAITNIAPPFICGALMAIVITTLRLFVLDDVPAIARFVLCVGAGGMVYLAALLIFARKFTVANIRELQPLLPRAIGGRIERFMPAPVKSV